MDPIKTILATVEGYIPMAMNFIVDVVIALVILFIGKLIIKGVLKFCDKFFEKTSVEISIRRFLDSLIKVILYIVLIIIICNKIGIDTASFIAVLGTLGLTIGLALQGSLSNFAGGVLIIMLKPFRVGDYIVDNGSGKEGVVDRVDLFYTKLISPDNKAIVLPNGALSNSAITNVTQYDKRRVDVIFSISYASDVEKAKEVLLKVAVDDEAVLKDIATAVVVTDMTAGQISVAVRAWCNTSDYWGVHSRILEGGKKALDDNGILIPCNKVKVHIENK